MVPLLLFCFRGVSHLPSDHVVGALRPQTAVAPCWLVSWTFMLLSTERQLQTLRVGFDTEGTNPRSALFAGVPER